MASASSACSVVWTVCAVARSGAVLLGTIATMAVCLLCSARPAHADPVLPGASGWTAVEAGGSALADASGDASSGSGRDLIGDSTTGVAWYASDGSYLYFRMRVEGDPTLAGTFRSYVWAVQISTDGDAEHYEWQAELNGIAAPDTVSLRENTTQTGGPADIAESLVASYAASTHAASGGAGGPAYYVAFAVLLSDLGITSATSLQFVFGTSNTSGSLGGDIAGWDGAPSSWTDVASDAVVVGVPEPASLALLAAGVAGLAARRGRRRRSG